MLNVIRTKHSRKILWVLSVIIIISFVFWGGASFFQERKQRVLARLGEKDITAQDFDYYYRMADLRLKLMPRDSQQKRATAGDITNLGWEYFLLLWKAEQDNIEVSDSQVVETVTRMFSQGPDGKFDQETYQWFLKRRGLAPRTFEEYIRNLLKIDMVFEKYAEVKIDDEEVEDTYKKETQEAKISYAFVPFDKFKDKITPLPQEIESFYNKNRDSFMQAAEVKIKYAAVSKDSTQAEEIKPFLERERTLAQVAAQFGLEIKESPFISLDEPIAGLGWQPMVNQAAFILQKNKLSSLIETYDGYVLLEKVDSRDSRLRSLAEVKEEVTRQFLEEAVKEKAKELADKLLADLNRRKRKNLKKFARKYRVKFKKAESFKYSGSIEGIGVNRKVSDVVFAMEKGQIHPEPILLFNGVYIIQLDDITPFDKETFAREREEYYNALYQEKSFRQRVSFVMKLQEEARLVIKQ